MFFHLFVCDTHTAIQQLSGGGAGGGGHRVRAQRAGGDSPRTNRVDTHTETDDGRARARKHSHTRIQAIMRCASYPSWRFANTISESPSLVYESDGRTITPNETFETQS